jgi:4,5-DOPA dioxygenase extradiol
MSPAREHTPVLFVGHGSPMNAVEDNRWSRGFRDLGRLVSKPRAVLCVSAHWYLDGTLVTSNEKPRTIHDFGGFPQELYEIEYPAPGSPALAERVVALLSGRAALDASWGLDHGTWSVLLHLFPEADVPVIQLSLDARLTPRQHLELARPLRALREEGVLILGSGNVTHNLGYAMRQRMTGDSSTPEWAARFDEDVKRALQAVGKRASLLERSEPGALAAPMKGPAVGVGPRGIKHSRDEQDDDALAERLPASEDGQISHPTLDHYLPLLYAAGASEPTDEVLFPIEGFDWGSLSMRSVLFRP